MKQKTHYLIFTTLALTCVVFIFNSCYYRPFIGYSLNNKGFKNFSEKEKIAGNNLNPQRDYHVNKYDWNLEVFPDKKKIAGVMTIYFTPLSSQSTFLFDLQNKMALNNYTCSIKNAKIERKGDLMYIKFKEVITPKTRVKLTIDYSGKPANLSGNGPIRWETDKENRHWISSVTEGIGPHFIMPCNTLLKSEADSCNINITVPNNLMAISNGQLKNIVSNNDTKTFNYQVTNPINTYSLSFNIGNFKKITKPYLDINGINRTIECQVLDYNFDIANTFYNQVPKIMQEFETIYGEFPWWSDGCKFIESNFSAMEHQSGIAMGDSYGFNYKGYNPILVHELSHEWWGNNVTGYDYCDVWIHEGMATYSEALFFERIFGKEDYDKKIADFTKNTKNTIPIHKVCNVLYNSWVNEADQDTYSKGALLMHSLRKVVNDDSLFFDSLLTIQKDLAKQSISTEELISKFNTLLNNDYSTLFDWYLNKIEPPTLQVKIDLDNNTLDYKWKEDVLFYKNKTISILNEGNIVELIPTLDFKTFSINAFDLNNFLIGESIYYVVDVLK